MSERSGSEVRLIALRGDGTAEGFVDSWKLCEGTWERAWEAGITEEEGRALATGGAVPDGEPIPFDALNSGRSKLHSAFPTTQREEGA